MDLPTYTNIWRIEKRLYKLYDFRLPMPLPIGQLAVFTAISVPYVVLLTVLGLPFSHTLIWLYILPPGVLTWLATRPVLESKRLPELINSQLRYLAEPRVWCRLAPESERDVIRVSARVRRRRRRSRPVRAAVPARALDRGPQALDRGPLAARAARAEVVNRTRRPAASGAAPGRNASGGAASGRTAFGGAASGGTASGGVASGGTADRRAAELDMDPARRRKPARRQALPLAAQAALAPRAAVAFRDARTSRPATAAPRIGSPTPAPLGTGIPASAPRQPETPAMPAAREASASQAAQAVPASTASADPGVASAAQVVAAAEAGPGIPAATLGSAPLAGSATAAGAAEPAVAAPRAGSAVAASPAGPADAAERPAAAVSGKANKRPVVTVVREGPVAAPPAVESAIAGPSALRAGGTGQRVAVVPGGYRPGKPDRLQRDRARARLPITGPRAVVLLGCTVGAGQTTTALLLGEVLASVRDDSIAVLDLNPNAGSASRRALARPALSQAASLGQSRLRVLAQDQDAAPAAGSAEEAGPAAARPSDDLHMLDLASEENVIVLADPATPAVPRLVAVADHLILVAPATAAAAGAITMTFEWLEAHGQDALATTAILVINGVSRRAMPHVEAAERVVAGRCRAIVRVPWDDQLSNHQVKRAALATAAGSASQSGASHQQWTGVLSPGAVAAYTALAGVLVAGLADPEPAEAGR